MTEKEINYLLISINNALGEDPSTRRQATPEFWKEMDELRAKNKNRQRI